MIRTLLYLLIFILFFACNNQDTKSLIIANTQDSLFEKVHLTYAKGFEIAKRKDITIIKVKNPWQSADNIVYQYVLADSSIVIPSELKQYTIIRTPIKRVVCLSTTHLAFIDCISVNKTVVGVSGSDFVYNDYFRKQIDQKKIIDVGYDQNLNYELVLSLKPDLVIAYGVGGEISGYMNKLKDLGINVVINAEYLEENALAKAEWIKFIAAFYNQSEKADSLFNDIASQYNDLLKIVKQKKSTPIVMTGLPWKGSWYVPGGNSYLSHLISDAGGTYLFKDNDSRQSIPLTLENVFSKAQNADIWINSDQAKSINDILNIDERLAKLKILKSKEIYNNNARLNRFGGNDYWESGIVNPHIILKDMIKIFHPFLMKEHEFVYYKKIEN